MKEQRKIPDAYYDYRCVYFCLLASGVISLLVHAVNVNNEIQEGLFQSGRIMVESLQHILSVQTEIN